MNSLRDILKKEILLIDGGFGTYIQSLGLNDSDFGDKLGCMEYLNHSYPALVERVHAGYLEAGAMAVETNSFGGNFLKLSEYELADYVFGLNHEAAKIARKAADRFSTKKEKRFVIGSMGPTGKLPSSTDPVLGDITYYKLKEMFARQAEGLIAGGVDALLVETGQDLLEMKAAVNGAKDAARSAGKDIVIMAQFTLGEGARMLLGTEVSAAMASLGYLGVDVIGINCGTGPEEMELPVKFLSDNCGAYISCIPNAGLPRDVDGKAVYPLKPAEMAGIMAKYLKKYGLDMVGGCCGTTPEHIKAIAEKLKGLKKGKRSVGGAFVASSYRAFPIEGMTPPVKIGERINTQGSRRMKELLLAGDLDGIVELGKDQEEAGAELLDVCVVLTERNTEKEDIIILTKKLAESVKVPLAIDSTDPDVIQAALSNYPGTAFINSANLEDGGKKAGKIFQLAAEYGAFVICLVIGKKGMARTVGEKIAVARNIYKIAVKEYGLKPHQLVFDMLTFSLGSGEKEYAGSAKETFEAIKRVKKELEGVLTVLGVSNVSFGLPKEGRSVLNAAYLAHAVKAGLDFAIVNPSQYVEYKKIPLKQRTLSDNLIFDKNTGALEKFTAYFMKGNTAKAEPALKSKKTPVEKRLAECVIQRNKRDIEALVGEALLKFTAQEIIGDILLKTMREVGDKLASGELVLPYVLQSAEVMRKALEVLGKHLPKDDIYKKGRIVLATVFGDVHDIGKNLVKMILSNNGFEVIDLGKQVPAEKIIEEAKRLQADAVGLSALLVSTARHMRSFVQALADAGMNYPVLIGGAATNSLFAKDISILSDKSVYRGGVFYAKDAFAGLTFAEVLVDKVEKVRLKDEYLREVREYISRVKGQGSRVRERSVVDPAFAKTSAGRQGSVQNDELRTTNHEPRDSKSVAKRRHKVPKPPFLGVKVLEDIPREKVFDSINEKALFSMSWGAKLKDKAKREQLLKGEYKPLLKELGDMLIKGNWVNLKAVYGYFRCRRDGDKLLALDGRGSVLEKFHFGTFPERSVRSLAHYFSEGEDIVAFQAVTVGGEINKLIAELEKMEEYNRMYLIHGLSVQLAEALAGYVHDHIRKELRIAEGSGKRYSPGYPLWKDLADQRKLFKLLRIKENIGVDLTEECQLVPEQSTTAMVVHSALAEY